LPGAENAGVTGACAGLLCSGPVLALPGIFKGDAVCNPDIHAKGSIVCGPVIILLFLYIFSTPINF
jgi:hypothetical protein